MSDHRMLGTPRLLGVLTAVLIAVGVCGRASAQLLDPDPPEPVVQVSDYVREIYQDREGNYWFGTNGDGVCRHDGTSLTYFNVGQGFGGSAVRGIVQDEAGAMWFGTDGGVSRYKDGAFTNYTVKDGLSASDVWSIMLDRAGTIWAGTHQGVCRLEGETFVAFPLPRVEVEKPESRFSPKVVFAMIEDRAGNLWFGTDGEGVHRYDGKAFTSYTAKDGLTGNMVRALCEDRQGRIWIGTDGGGVSCFDGTTFRTFTAEDGLNNDRVYEIIQDRAGNMWFSTLGAGACRYDGTEFKAFSVDQGLSTNELACHCGSGRRFKYCHGPNGVHVQEMLEDKDGILWFGCSGGLFRLDGERFINVTRDGPWGTAAHRMEEAIPEPMQRVGRLVGGEWKMVTDTEVGLITRWDWGPARYSLRGVIDGVGGDRQPWRALSVVYWHPASKQVRSLGVSQYREGVAEGVIGIEGEMWENVAVMHQAGDRRDLKWRWTFDRADRFHDELMESTGPEGYFPLASWDWVRTALPATPRAFEVAGAARPSERLKALAPLLDHAWAAENAGRELRSSITWVPLSNVVCLRVDAIGGDGERTLLLDAYVYFHTGRRAIRCLALTETGGVYEGDVMVKKDGALELALTGHVGERVEMRDVRLDFEKDGTVRGRVWSVAGDERALMVDLFHKPRGTGIESDR